MGAPLLQRGVSEVAMGRKQENEPLGRMPSFSMPVVACLDDLALFQSRESANLFIHSGAPASLEAETPKI